MTKNDRAVCIHGHFYQPPRESPWREEIEAQDSAGPFHDWNERIADECYAPCAGARLLDERGQVRRVMNLYARMSFNVGPTLLSWMETADPATYRAILAADRASRERFSGHGSAIAQAYGHAILPLATRRDKETQVRWGIRDFEHRFQRRPEALWLPETAVDTETLEVLAGEGMRYVLLAPHQVRRVRPLQGAWTDVTAGTIDTTQPYLVHLPSGGSIAVFVYDGSIAHGVSFGDLLENGDRFLARLEAAAPRDEGLVHVATDGETYGHHHRFGEMALAYVLEKLETHAEARLTNYGEWLEMHPPAHEAEIAPNTSWSCAHGVERWRADCGCTTYSRPGWTQAWRAPLRRAVDELAERLDNAYATRARPLFRDPWAARDAYVDALLNPGDVHRFLDAQAARPLDAGERTTALELLEMQRHRLLTLTSCGWYFADLAGIEAVQVLRYAARAIELAHGLGERDVEEPFLERLAEARSNDPAAGDGRRIYERLVRSAAVDASRAAREHALAALFDRDERHAVTARTALASSSSGIATADLERVERRTAAARLVAGRVRVQFRRTHRTADMTYAGLRSATTSPLVGARPAVPADRAAELAHLFDETGPSGAARQITATFPPPIRLGDSLSPRALADLEADVAALALESVADGESALALLADPRIERSGGMRGLALFSLHRRLERLAQRSNDIDALEALLEAAMAASLPVNGAVLAHEVGRMGARELGASDALDREVMERLERAVALARRLAADVNLWRAQEACLHALRKLGTARGEMAGSLARLAHALAVQPTEPGFVES